VGVRALSAITPQSVGTDGPFNVAQTATVSGGGLTWTLVRRTNMLTNVTVQSVLTNPATPDRR
jgi:hypothetical protein